MRKSEKDIFQKFIKRVSDFSKPELNQSANEEYKNNIFKNNRINNYDLLNINNTNSQTKKKFMEFPSKNRNKDKIPFSNFNYSLDNNSNAKKNLKNGLRECEFQNKNKYQLNTRYTNPFINKNNYPFDYNNDSNNIELLNKNNNDYENISSNYSNNHNDNTNDDTFDNTIPKILENSEKINNNEDCSYNNLNKNNNNISNNKKKRKINYDNYESIEKNNGGNKCKYLLIGFLGTYSAVIFLNKNEKFRKMLKSNIDKIDLNLLLDYVQIFFEKIKSNKYISELKVLLNNGIDYLTKLFDGFNDGLRLISIFIMIIIL